MTRRFRLGAALGAAVAFAPKAWLNAWGSLGLLTAVLAAPAFLTSLPAQAWLHAAWAVALVIAGVMAEGALYRVALAPGLDAARKHGLGLGGVQFAMDEVHLLAAGGLVALFVALVVGVALLVVAFVMQGTGLADAHWGDALGIWRMAREGDARAVPVVAVAAVLALMIAPLIIRLAPYKAATVGRGRVVSLDAMGLTAGAFWSFAAGLVLVSLPALLLSGWRPEALGFGPTGAKAVALVRAGVLGLVQVPLAAGFLSAAYKQREYLAERHDGGN